MKISIYRGQILSSFSKDKLQWMKLGSTFHFRDQAAELAQWKHDTSRTPVKFCKIASAGRVMASVCCDSDVIKTVNYLAGEMTMTDAYYSELILQLSKKKPDKVMLRFAALS